MSTKVLGYICVRNAGDGRTNDATAQRAALENHAQRNGFTLQAIFTDDADTARIAWFDRPGGRQLADQLCKGSHVIVADPAAICNKLSDLLGIILDFQARGITLHLLGLTLKNGSEISLSTSGELGEMILNVLRMMVSMAKNNRSENVSEALREKKRQGKKHSRYAGYGFRWRRGKREADPQEQTIIADIVEWREKGFSWHEIAAHLLRCKIVAATGREWSPSRVRRAYVAELQRRAIVE